MYFESILVIDKIVESKVNGEGVKISHGQSFAVTNLTDISVENLLEIKTSHWSIEASHWLLDVQFNEDRCQARKENSAANLSSLRRFVLAVYKAVKIKTGNKSSLKMFMNKNTSDFSRIEEYLFTYCVY